MFTDELVAEKNNEAWNSLEKYEDGILKTLEKMQKIHKRNKENSRGRCGG